MTLSSYYESSTAQSYKLFNELTNILLVLFELLSKMGVLSNKEDYR